MTIYRARFDNPQTRRREVWVDGDVKAYVVKEIISAWPTDFGGQWIDGQILGNARALDKKATL